MIPTRTQVLDAARGHLNDTAKEDFTDTVLAPFFEMAYRELWRAMSTVSVPRVRRIAYYDVPANTSLLVPSTAGITDMGEPEFVEERGNVSEVAISNVTGTTTVSVTTGSAHGRSSGDTVVTFGIGGFVGATGEFSVSVTGASAVTLLGAVGSGTYTSGGTLAFSTEDWTRMQQVPYIRDYQSPANMFGYYSWQEDVFRFQPCSGIRQLRIVYLSSGAPPAAVGDSCGIDDCLDYLAFRTAGLAAASRSAGDIAQFCNITALGPTLQPDASGGLLRQMIQLSVRAMQAQTYRRQPFRRHAHPDRQIL